MLFTIQTVFIGTILILQFMYSYTGLRLQPKCFIHVLYIFMPVLFFQNSFYKDQKGQKSLKNKSVFLELLRLIVCHSKFFLEKIKLLLMIQFFDDPAPNILLIQQNNRITLPLSFNTNLTKLGPTLEKLYCTYYILYVYQKKCLAN